MTASSRHEGYLPPMPSTPQKGRTASSSSSHSSSSASASTSSAPFPLSPQLASPSSRSPMPYNYHPYQIQTTASSLLTRSNSSPLQPVSEYKHRSSRSMGSMGSMSYLSHSVSDGELAVTAGNHARAVNGGKAGKGLEGDKEARRRSMDGASPVMPKLRRSGTLPVFPRDDQVTPTKDSIPDNPKHWPPAQLARYLTITLRNGDTGHTLPLPLIKDIEAWVLRQQVSGRAFLKGQSESWATSARAPPFLPMLLNISRRLRRSSLQSRLGDTPSSPLPTAPDSPLGSILLEAEENEEVNEEAVSDEDDTGVRRMARLIERPASAASSASSASINGDDNVRPRLNSGNSQAWKEWEARGVGWVGRRRKESGASSCADQAERFGREHQERVVSGGSAGSASSATSATSASSGMSGESEVLETPLDVATIKPARTVPVGLGFEVAMESQTSSIPPSSYSPGNINGEKVQMDVADHAGDAVAVSKDQDEMTSPHMANMLSHQSTGSEPYASIRQAPGSRIPSLRSLRHAQAIRDFATTKSEDGQEADDEMSHLATARRVTLRPTATDIFGAPAAGHNDSEALMRQREREKEMEDQMAVLAARVKQLEEQLQFEREEKDKAVMQHTRWVREREEMENYFNERQKARSQEEQVKMDDMYRKITRLAEAELLSRPIEGATTTEYDTDSDTTTSNEKEVAGASKAVTKSSRPGTPLDMLPEGVLARLGLIPEQDGLPTRMRELPAYLFFVGVGVGAVMVRLLFSRSR